MDQDKVMINKLKVLGAFFLITIIAIFKSYTDIKFAITSDKAEATFMKFSQKYKRRGRSSNKQHVRYTFIDKNGQSSLGYDSVGLDWYPPVDKKLRIVYLVDELETDGVNIVSRLEESSGTWGLSLLLIGLIGTSISGYTTYKYMSESTPS